LGLALLLTYKSSGAKDNIWPAVFGFTNPILLTIILIWRGKIEKPNMLEIICAVIGIVSIILWYFLQESKEYVQYALYLAIFADACAAIPTVLAYFKNPDEDRPFAWLLFGMGWILAIFAVPEDTIANYALPAYMAIASLLITLPLIVYRIKNKVKITEWI
jgi:drug/metabolite transporter (DMT)-like permease